MPGPRAFPMLLALLLAAAPALGADAADDRARLASREALYYATQGEWFDAVVRIDARQVRARAMDRQLAASLAAKLDPAAGSYELSYRMHRPGGRAMTALINGAVTDPVRNEALFRLARLYVRQDRPEEARQALERIRGEVPGAIRIDLAFLRANVAMSLGRNADAVAVLNGLQEEKDLKGFNSYNLGIALLRGGDEQAGRQWLDRTGKIESDDPAVLAIRDKANLVLGEQLMGDAQYQPAKEMLDRIRLAGPFSNRALLSSGWGSAMQEQYKIALVPWTELAGREATDPAVQEAMLAVPYAYGRLAVYTTAAVRYEAALAAFSQEINKLDASIVSIHEGAFLKDLLREELRQDADWIVRLRELPESPETLYLLDLMASNDFQEALKSYLDLADLRKKLDAWTGDLNAFEDLITLRWAHFKTLMPEIDRDYGRLDARARSAAERRDALAKQLDAMRTDPRPELFLSAEERRVSEQVARLEATVLTPRNEKYVPALCNRVRRLRGILTWNRYASFDARVEAARAHLRELDQQLEAVDRRRRSFARTRLTAIEGYQGYVDLLRRLREGVDARRDKVRDLMERQGRVLEVMAVEELTARRDRLEEFRAKARFALADSYDRANKARMQKQGAR